MAFDKQDIYGELSEMAHIGKVGDEGTFGTYGIGRNRKTRIGGQDKMGYAISKKTTFIYFMRSKTLGFIKIGYTNDLSKRKAECQTGSADELYFMGSILFPNKERAEEAESQLHVHFKNFHSHGEWFLPDESLIAFIQAVTDPDELEEFLRPKKRGRPRRVRLDAKSLLGRPEFSQDCDTKGNSR